MGVPPHSLVDVDIVDKEGTEVAEEQVQLEQNVLCPWITGILQCFTGTTVWAANGGLDRLVPEPILTVQHTGLSNQKITLCYYRLISKDYSLLLFSPSTTAGLWYGPTLYAKKTAVYNQGIKKHS